MSDEKDKQQDQKARARVAVAESALPRELDVPEADIDSDGAYRVTASYEEPCAGVLIGIAFASG